jgi:hypothetical protein
MALARHPNGNPLGVAKTEGMDESGDGCSFLVPLA